MTFSAVMPRTAIETTLVAIDNYAVGDASTWNTDQWYASNAGHIFQDYLFLDVKPPAPSAEGETWFDSQQVVPSESLYIEFNDESMTGLLAALDLLLATPGLASYHANAQIARDILDPP